MSNASDLFRRAEKNGKRRCVPKPQSPAMFAQNRMPAPQPMQPAQPPQAQQLPPQAEQPPARQLQARYPVGSHANYSALMRSHDRMNTRHLPKS